MTDRYTELVKAAYEAQQAREGERYKDLTNELTKVDTELEALSAQREAVVAHLEGLDDAVEGARDALDAYFAGREEDAHPLTRDHMYEHDEDELGPKASYEAPDKNSHGLFDDELRQALAEQANYGPNPLYVFGSTPAGSFFGRAEDIAALPTEEDEYASAKANGALS